MIYIINNKYYTIKVLMISFTFLLFPLALKCMIRFITLVTAVYSECLIPIIIM